jgi:hypothetical protein
MVLLTGTVVAADVDPAGDQPYCAAAWIKDEIYPATTPLHAPQRHTRAREGERKRGAWHANECSATRTLDPRVTRSTHDQRTINAVLYHKCSLQRNRDLYVLCVFVGVTASCVTVHCPGRAELLLALRPPSVRLPPCSTSAHYIAVLRDKGSVPRFPQWELDP